MKAKTDIQVHKQTAQEQLAARLTLLESKGMDAEAAKKDPVVKMFKAEIRQAARRLASASAKEQLIARKIQDKADKAAAKKLAAEAPPAPKAKGKKGADSAPEKAKKAKDKKPAAAKK
jgi:hypothetical protein